MNAVAFPEIESLSVPERLQLVEDIWDSIACSSSQIPVPQWQKDELDRRKQAFIQNPDSGETWEQVKHSILNGK